MAKPPFPIPKPWQSGLAIPGYMQNEGLREGAFVTHPTPRGTYDAPNPFDPSWDKTYAVPDYILSEGYGQGARVTHWQPRGTYVGATGMGDTSVPAIPSRFAAYGQKAARTLIAQVSRLPPASRKSAIRRLMNRIDPSLFSRTERYAQQFAAQGHNPQSALELGMAKAMAEGFTKEIVDTGKKGVRPAARGQLGLGCYARRRGVAAALGDIAALKATRPLTAIASVLTPASSSGRQCSADGKFVWVNDHWERIRAGQTCETFVPSGSSPTIRTGSSGGVTVTDSSGQVIPAKVSTAPSPDPALKMVQVGAFMFPADAKQSVQRWHKKLPADWQSAIRTVVSQPNPNVSPINWRLSDFVDGLPSLISNRYIGTPPTSGTYPSRLGWAPVLKATHPISGKDYGVFLAIGPQDGKSAMNTKDASGKIVPNPDPGATPVLQVIWSEIDKAWYQDLWNWIKSIVVKVVDFAADVLSEVADLACTVLQGKAAITAGAAAGAAYGGTAGAGAGAQGVQLAQVACSSPPPPSSDEESSFPILPVAIAGGAVLAIAAFWPKKKRT